MVRTNFRQIDHFLFLTLTPRRERKALLLNELSGDKYNSVQDIFQATVLNTTEKERLKSLNLAESESLNHHAISFCWPNLGSTDINFREENRSYLLQEIEGESKDKPFSYLTHSKL